MSKQVSQAWLPLIICALCSWAWAQGASQTPVAPQAASSPSANSSMGAADANIEEYIVLLHTDVRQQKAELMGAMMQLDPSQARKFWPIYAEYDSEMSKINIQDKANVQDYARNAGRITASQADETALKSIDYQRRRTDLLYAYYDRVKEALGPLEATRFLQIEVQLLDLMDLQLEAALPVH